MNPSARAFADRSSVESTGKVAVLRNLQQQAYDVLLTRILEVTPGYEPGSRLDLPAIAEELGISLTPVKESIRLLQAQGLIEISSRSGTWVASLTHEELDEHFELLRELEFAAIRLARERMTTDGLRLLREQVDEAYQRLNAGLVVDTIRSNWGFHERLVALSGNHQLLQLYCSPRAYSLSTVYRSTDPSVRRFLIDQHREICEALEAGDFDLAVARIASHWEESCRLAHIALDSITQYGRAR
ncbi:MAG: hypothetical protein QOF33_3879 [Thermomicrobiales bacterium]|nr:hypothetical protein [Thermomicrobiales bacterium]